MQKILMVKFSKFRWIECIIFDNFDKNIDENTFYSILNNIKQAIRYICSNHSNLPLTKMKV